MQLPHEFTHVSDFIAENASLIPPKTLAFLKALFPSSSLSSSTPPFSSTPFLLPPPSIFDPSSQLPPTSSPHLLNALSTHFSPTFSPLPPSSPLSSSPLPPSSPINSPSSPPFKSVYNLPSSPSPPSFPISPPPPFPPIPPPSPPSSHSPPPPTSVSISQYSSSPPSYLLKLYLEISSDLFDSLLPSYQEYNKIGILSVRSKTLKNWRERTVVYNFWSKELRIYKDKEQNPKKVKFFVNLNNFVVRWIDDKKFSLNSLSSTSIKLILFSSHNQLLLNDWYENFRLSIANSKPMLERKIQVDLTRSTRIHSKSELIMRKTHSNQKCNNEEGKLEKEEEGERRGRGVSKDVEGKNEHVNRSLSPIFSPLEEEEGVRREELEGWRRESFECKNDYFGISGIKKEKSVKPEKKKNPDPIPILNSIPTSYDYSKFYHREAKLSDETGYELIAQKGRHRILRSCENKLKFKFFLHFNFFSPFIEDLLLYTPHFWNPAISQFQIRIKISEKEGILVEKRRKIGDWYLPRVFVMRRKVERIQDITIIEMKLVKSTNTTTNLELAWPSIKGTLKRFLICLKRRSGTESEVKGYYWADNGGLVSEEQNARMSLEYLKGFLDLERFIREKCIFEM